MRDRRRLRRAGGSAVLLAALLVSGAPCEWAGTWTEELDGPRHGAELPGGEAEEITDVPPPGFEVARAPLGRPAPLAGESDRFAFLHTQPGSRRPVAYDPCRPVHFVVNARRAPPGAEQLLAEALAEVQRATGLVFVADGPTDEVPVADRQPYQPDRYPGRWAPVLIAWSDPSESPDLKGDSVGVAGSTWFSVDDRERVYVTGEVVLDGPELARMLRQRGGRDAVRAVILHELGHLVGLDHVDDPDQIMYPDEGSATTFAAGDLTGLSRLGGGRCRPEV